MAMQLLIRSRNRLPTLTTDKLGEYPLLRLQTGVLFPHNMMTLQVRRDENLKVIETCLNENRELVASFSHFGPSDEGTAPIHQVGTFSLIRDSRKAPGGIRLVTIEGLRRAVIDAIVGTEPYTTVTAAELEPQKVTAGSINSRMQAAISLVDRIVQLDPAYSPELLPVLSMNDDPSLLADRVAASLRFPLALNQELLEAVNLSLRYDKLLTYLERELTRVSTLQDVNRGVSTFVQGADCSSPPPLSDTKKQLGQYGQEEETSQMRDLITGSTNLPPEVMQRATIEVDRLARLPSASAEYGTTKNYLDWILALPWGKSTPEDYDISEVGKIISSDYFGPDNIKEQILQRLSVRKLAATTDGGPTLCLVGASGTGKASLAKAIARALGKKFCRISVGGISKVEEIKGMSRTFLGAMPGKILRALRDVGSCDPVVLIEDIDYFNLDNKSSINMALLEVVDSRFNSRFIDNYLGIPFDFSKIIFVCSVRSFEEIPEQFIPRFELLEIPGYIEKEKIIISKKYIIPTIIKRHGIKRSEFRVSDKTLSKIIRNYTQEAGLVGFAQQLEKICRKIALEKLEKRKTSWNINEKNIESFLGRSLFIPEKAETLPEIGTATGLAWTGSGGDLMFIEGLKMKGDGQITTTGSLGDVMKESIQAAHSYVRSKADMLGIDFSDFNEFDVHIHFPSGAIPKDGPSAGVTVCLVIASVMAERPIRNDIAMTGEVTLRGRVLPVGGTKEKISAAYRTGIFHVVLPSENKKDIKDLPREILRKTKFTYIDRVDELFELCLLDFTPSSFSLEKVFAEEIEKAQKKTKKRRSTKSRGKVAKSSKNQGV